MSELETGSEDSPASVDEPAEDAATADSQEELPGVDPAPEEETKPAKNQIKMVNSRKAGRVFPFKDLPIEPGESYSVSETKAKKMEKIAGNFRQGATPK